MDLNNENDIIEMAKNLYKKTLSYEMDKLKINEDGTTTHIHSDEFLDNHPERRDNPEFTKEEEKEVLSGIAKLAKEDFEKFGPLNLNKNKKE